MHILLVNDDGPPSRRLSPYVRPLVNALQDAGHLVSVAIPAASRSWIGKAHIIEAPLKATYVPPSAFRNDGTWDETSSPLEHREEEHGKSEPEWVVITNGTPASCVQLGLFNLFADRPPVDLVISGPNHGRNASTIYNLSSGTVGGALEAATCGKRGIAVSFGSKDEQPMEIIQAAARLAVRIIHHLYKNWDERVELYNLNIPMREDVETRPVLYTRTLPYYWSHGCLYAEVEKKETNGTNGTMGHHAHNGDTHSNGVNGVHKVNGVNGVTNGVKAGATNGVKPTSRFRQRDFKWSAELADMKKALQTSEEGTDAHTVLNGSTSVTPLCANFWFVPGLEGELKL
ncbi:survival protein sure-like phosphatase/nucleotidase [Aspergillus granulosus]|uniref:Survival protein sure-like phosphatase/nucleotidase n=1 Tax=Aspergillus granulosus TaxID=176169 RepID=A0ABR4I495_9EURO